MEVYSVADIAKILSVEPETVRRWIRSGKLKATCSSRKGGNVITEEALRDFLNHAHHAKYAKSLTKALNMTSTVVGGGIGAAGKTRTAATTTLLETAAGIVSLTQVLTHTIKNLVEKKSEEPIVEDTIKEVEEFILQKKQELSELQYKVTVLEKEIIDAEQALAQLQAPVDK